MDEILDNFKGLSISSAQLDSTGREAPTLSNLATELKVTILKNMSDIPSLKALVQSSNGYHAAFVSHRHDILSSVVGLIEMQPEVLVDALAVRDASITIEPGCGEHWKSKVRHHVKEYQDSRLSVTPAFRYGDAKDLNGLHSIVRDLTRHFTSTVLPNHPVTGEKMDNIDNVSKEETRRLHRALYRFELYGKFFPDGPHTPLGDDPEDIQRASFDAIDISRLYFSIFEAYEVEEIACLYNYIWEIYAEGFRKLVAELVPKKVSIPAMWLNADVNHLMSLGLRFLHQVLYASSHDEKLALLEASLNSSFPTFAQVLKADAFSSNPRLSELEGSGISFANDDGSGPNAAWVWSTGGVYEFAYFQAEKAAMRSWGYVFWDKKRLDSWGVLEINPKVFVDAAMEESYKKHMKYFQ